MAHPYITAPTGGPKITTDFDPSDPSYAALTLALPDFDEFLEGRMVDESTFNERLSKALSLIRPRQRRTFSFGYKALDTAVAEALIDILKERTVRFTPRTLAAGDPSDPSSLAEVVEYTCRVVGEVPFTRHLTTGYRITVNLEELATRETPPTDEALAPPIVATIGGVVIGGTSPEDEEPETVAAEAPDPSSPCVIHRQGFATIPAYDPSDPSASPTDPSLLYVTITPSPPFPEPLDDADADVEFSAWLSGPPYGIQSVWVPRDEITAYSFIVRVDQVPTSDATIAWRGTMVRNKERCRPCWARDTWHTGNTHNYFPAFYPVSACAPFPDIPATYDLSVWQAVPAARMGRTIGTMGGNLDTEGQNSPRYATVYLYYMGDNDPSDPSQPSWSNSPQLPAKSDLQSDPDIHSNQSLCAVDGRWYVIGGDPVYSNQWNVYSWAPPETEWTTEAVTLPPGDPSSGTWYRSNGAHIHYGGDFYMIGGIGKASDHWDNVLKFDGTSFSTVHTFSNEYSYGIAALGGDPSEIYYMGGRKNGTDSLEIWTSTGGAFTLQSKKLPTTVFGTKAAGSSGDGQAIYFSQGASYWTRYDIQLDQFFTYPRILRPSFPSVSTTNNSVVSADGLIYIMGCNQGRYMMHVYVPFEPLKNGTFPINPFTGEEAYEAP